MKKVKFSKPSKLVGKVFFQRQSTQKSCDVESEKSQMTKDIKPSQNQEIDSLKNQIEVLEASVNFLKLDTEDKEIKLAKIAREKEQLSLSLAKMKRSNINLIRQLEDERNFYYKEKEAYCQEMNECKKLKRALSNSNVASQIDSAEEIDKLKGTLEKTLQTNYNLSIKFLRMKETKTYLNNYLNKTQEEHKRIVNDLKIKIENLTSELKEILNQKFDAPLSPSNKKYLHLVNQNSSLVYENLCLQMQVDQLKLKLKRNKTHRTKSEINNRIQDVNKERRNKTKTRNTSTDEQNEIIKIYERENRPGLPTVTILNEKEIVLKAHSSERKLQLPVVNESKLTVFQVSELQSRDSNQSAALTKLKCKSAPKIIQTVNFKKSCEKDNENR